MAENKKKAKQDEKAASAKGAKAPKNSKKGKNVAASKSKKDSKKKAPKKGKDGKAAKPSLWTRIITYFKNVKTELQRVVWPTKKELLNASVIVIGALVFFGVFIAIIDGIIINPLGWISGLGD